MSDSNRSNLKPPTKDGCETRRRKSLSNSSRLSFRIHQTLNKISTRIQTANKLSMAKRLEEQESESGGALLDDPSLSSPKNLNQIITEISNEKRNEINQNCIPRDGVIGGGSLIFDIDYSLPSMKQKNISRPYAYIKSDASIKNVMDLIINDWHLSLPRIILFLISDPDHFRNWNNYRQITSFKTGVMKAAKTTSMWLVTNGLDVGCGKLIGDALIDEQNEMRTYRPMLDECRRQFPVIGIANDNNLSYTQDLTGPMIFLNKTPPLSSEHHRYELNCMHTNFILLETENSSESLYQNFLINFIDYLNKKNLNYQHDDCEDHLNDNSIVENNLVFQTSSKVSNVNAIRDKRRESQSNVNSIIIRPSQGQSSDCFTPDDDMMDASQDDELDEDDYSFISPDGTIVEEQPSKRSHRHNFEVDTPDRRISEEKSIPVVCLVIQGDYHCAKLVLDNIRRRNPVIVLRGSGGFADLLSFAYIEMQQRCRDLYQSWDVEFVEQALKPLLMQKIVKLFPSFRSNSLARNKFRDRIIECVRESNCSRGRIYLSILNMNNSSCDLTNLSEFILLSLFKSQNRRDKIDSTLVRKDLYLTLDWNCPIVALDEVLIKNPSFNLQLEKSIFEIAILKSNREEFVDLFLSHGFRVHKYLTPFRLIRLIRFSLVESDFFRFICMEAILGIAVWSVTFEELIERLSQSTSEQSSSDPELFLTNEFNRLIYTTTSLHSFINVQDMYLNIMGMYSVDADSAERKALALLTMWAVFNRRFKLAEILWKHSDQPIHLGLIISMMFERIALFVSEQNIKDELQARSKIFSNFSIKVLDFCYRNDEQRGYSLLGEKSIDWNHQTAVDIAANGNQRAFIAHPCCQKWLTNTFNGRIRVRELNWGFLTIPPVMKIVLSAFLIFPMYVWIRFLDINNQWALNKTKLLDELSKEENDDHENDEELLSKAADALRLMPMNNHSEMNAINKSKISKIKDPRSNLDQIMLDNQMTIHSLDDDVKAALMRFTKKLKDRKNSSDQSSFYARQRNNLIIDRQPPIGTMIKLMWNSPITKFWTYQIFYIIYLALLSLAVVWPGCGNWYLDATVCLWTFLYLIEHVHRTFRLYQQYSSVPMFFRVLETILLIVFLLTYTWGRILIVYSYHTKGNLTLNRYNIDPYGMKVILCTGLLYFYYRMFYIHLPISPTLGPLLYRFKLMVSVDFIHFMRMALILLISSGIVMQTLLYPNTELSLSMFHRAFHRAIVSLFLTPVDELTKTCKNPARMSDLKENSSWFISQDSKKTLSASSEELCPVSSKPMSESCPVAGFWSYVFTFQYLICLKLILMTLLYALFASTATKLQTETDNIWKYQRYVLVIDYANQSALSAPLSIFKYFYWIINCIFRCLTFNYCRWCKRSSRVADKTDIGTFSKSNDRSYNDNQLHLTKEDYNYWKHLARSVYEEELQKEDEKKLISKQGETMQLICEELEHEKNILRSLKAKINEFERMLYQTQITLENLQHFHSVPIGSTGQNHKTRFTRSTNLERNSNQFSPHYLSRSSPYSSTRINRFPVADKFVSWDVIWIDYDPVIYSRKRENFPLLLKQWVDEDVLALKEQMKTIKRHSSTKTDHLPVFNWNAMSVNPAGLTIDRRSWIKQEPTCDALDCNLSPHIGSDDENSYLVYKLDEDEIPINLMGRTGLRGRGVLPRWGPNHYVLLLITRSRFNHSTNSIVREICLEHRYNNLFTPMRFIGDEKLFNDLKILFQQPQAKNWETEEDLYDFFKSIDSSVMIELPQIHYMDSPDNTDNAWKEVKIYHFHYDLKIDLNKTAQLINLFDLNTNGSQSSRNICTTWTEYSEDMLVQLPMEQIPFINEAIKRINNWDN